MIRVLMADDHPVVREGLTRLLANYGDIRLVGEASDGEELLELTRSTYADVVLLDVYMPGMAFTDVMRTLRTEHPRLAVLVLSGQSETHYGPRVLRAGAAGFLGKESVADELADAIRRAAAGGKYISPALAESLAETVVNPPTRAAHEALSDREFEVLKGTASGKPVKQMAQELGISPKTVSTYRRRVLEKLNLTSQAEAIRYAVSRGIVVDSQLDHTGPTAESS